MFWVEVICVHATIFSFLVMTNPLHVSTRPILFENKNICMLLMLVLDTLLANMDLILFKIDCSMKIKFKDVFCPEHLNNIKGQ